MKQNDLEKIIHEHRDQFDDSYPSLKLWANIEKELEGKGKEKALKTQRPWYQIAATALILISLGGIGGMYLNEYNQTNSIQAMIDKVAPEFNEMEQYYSQRIDQQYARLTAYTNDPEIDSDLALVDQAMAELREELAHAPIGREGQIIEALIENYRLKLQILERILDQINQSTNITPNNNSNETSI